MSHRVLLRFPPFDYEWHVVRLKRLLEGYFGSDYDAERLFRSAYGFFAAWLTERARGRRFYLGTDLPTIRELIVDLLPAASMPSRPFSDVTIELEDDGFYLELKAAAERFYARPLSDLDIAKLACACYGEYIRSCARGDKLYLCLEDACVEAHSPEELA